MALYLSTLKPADNYFRFPRLTSVAKLVLTIPHSNARQERLFSMVRKNLDLAMTLKEHFQVF